MRIGVFGHYGNANMGDEAIVQATLESLRRRIPGAELACFTINKADSEQRHGVPSYPIRRLAKELGAFEMVGEPERPVGQFQYQAPKPPEHTSGIRSALKKIPLLGGFVRAARLFVEGLQNLPSEVAFLYRNYRLLKQFDLLMVTGSNQFLDNFGGLWGFPYTVLKWAVIARLAGCKLALVSLGAGPLTGSWSKRFCRWSLGLAAHASYRDFPSRELIEGSGPDYKGKVYPDVATNIDLPPRVPRGEGAKLRVGINPMPVYDSRYWHASDDNLYAAYIDKLVALVRHVIARGHAPCLFSTQIQDNNVIGDVLSQLTPEEDQLVTVRQPRSVDALLDVLANLDISVPTRFHGSVLSLRTGLPTLGICYHRKIGDLLTDVGLGDFQVTFEEFTIERISGLLDRLVEERAEAEQTIAGATARYLAALDQQYDELAALVGH
ncbi:MAG: polysaccharide pyruvyl transferase family protein [Pseudomonadota bacterium]